CLIPCNISGDYSCKKVRILNLFPYYFIELTYRNDSRIFSSSTASRSSSESCETVGRVDLNRFAFTIRNVPASSLPLTPSKTFQYTSVRQGIFSGSRVIISRLNVIDGLCFRQMSKIRGRSSSPCPSGTSDNKNPSSYSATPISFTCVLKARGARVFTTSIGSSMSEML